MNKEVINKIEGIYNNSENIFDKNFYDEINNNKKNINQNHDIRKINEFLNETTIEQKEIF